MNGIIFRACWIRHVGNHYLVSAAKTQCKICIEDPIEKDYPKLLFIEEIMDVDSHNLQSFPTCKYHSNMEWVGAGLKTFPLIIYKLIPKVVFPLESINESLLSLHLSVTHMFKRHILFMSSILFLHVCVTNGGVSNFHPA